MSQVTSQPESVRLLPETIHSLIASWIARSAGLALIAFAAIGWLSVITWSNADPSLTQTTAAPTRNLLGPLGAIVSDLLLQTLGMAALVALGGPLITGLEMMISRRMPRFSMKAFLFPLVLLVLAGGVSALPTLPSWPLHHGYGGLIGDLVFNMSAAIMLPVAGERAGLLGGFILIVAGSAGLVHSLGLGVFGPMSGPAPQPGAPRGHAFAAGHPEAPFTVAGERSASELSIAPIADDAAFQSESEDFDPAVPAFELDTRPADDTAPIVLERDADPRSAPFEDEPETEPGHDDDRSDPALADAREFARRFAPAKSNIAAMSALTSRTGAIAPAAVPGKDAVAKEEPALPSSHKLPSMLRGFAPVRSKGWRRPPLGLLNRSTPRADGPSTVALHARAGLLVDVLADFGVKGEVRGVRSGPVVTLFEVQLARGIKSSRVVALADDIARAMSATAARVVALPGQTTIGIELPNMKRDVVMLRDVVDSDAFRSPQLTLPLALGCAIDGEPVVADLARMPHLLVAGTTGSGKSVGVNAMILSLLYTHDPKDCRLLLIDPKMLELAAYDGIPHLISPVVTDPDQAVSALDWAVGEMEERYKRMARLGVRNIEAFNSRIASAESRGEALERTVQTGFDPATGAPVYERQAIEETSMAHIVVVVDEFADLMMMSGRQLETAVQRLAQKARAAGIHLIMATQRPSVDIVTGTIKANFPTRISFRVASKVDSRTILGEAGAEQLLGHGDMLLAGGAGQPLRVHGAYVSEGEVEAVVASLKAQGRPDYVPGVVDASRAAAAQPAMALPRRRGKRG